MHFFNLFLVLMRAYIKKIGLKNAQELEGLRQFLERTEYHILLSYFNIKLSLKHRFYHQIISKNNSKNGFIMNLFISVQFSYLNSDFRILFDFYDMQQKKLKSRLNFSKVNFNYVCMCICTSHVCIYKFKVYNLFVKKY